MNCGASAEIGNMWHAGLHVPLSVYHRTDSFITNYNHSPLSYQYYTSMVFPVDNTADTVDGL
jgi:hypothetical protein